MSGETIDSFVTHRNHPPVQFDSTFKYKGLCGITSPCLSDRILSQQQ